jgi:hypothetical protein
MKVGRKNVPCYSSGLPTNATTELLLDDNNKAHYQVEAMTLDSVPRCSTTGTHSEEAQPRLHDRVSNQRSSSQKKGLYVTLKEHRKGERLLRSAQGSPCLDVTSTQAVLFRSIHAWNQHVFQVQKQVSFTNQKTDFQYTIKAA